MIYKVCVYKNKLDKRAEYSVKKVHFIAPSNKDIVTSRPESSHDPAKDLGVKAERGRGGQVRNKSSNYEVSLM
jgi:hypothetical protein